MAKKRKLQSSEPTNPLQPEPQPEIKQEQTEETDQNMSVDEETDPIDEQHQPQIKQEQTEAEPEDLEEQEQEEEEEPQEDETLENQTQPAAVTVKSEQIDTAEANGVEEINNNEIEEDLDLEEEPVEKLLEPFTKEQLHVLVKQAIEKYPDLSENVRQLADVDPAHRKIFVHGLGWDTTAETLIGEFSKYGEIEDCKAVTDKVSGKSKGYAFILFKHRSGCRRALKQPQKMIGNRNTSSQLASAGPVPAPPPIVPVSEYTQRKIFVSNVSSDIEPQKLLEFFQQFGEVEDGPLGLDKTTGKPKGFALFVYKSVESAKKALEEPNKTFEGHTLNCQKAVDGPKGYNKGFQQQHHHQPHHSHHHRPHQNRFNSRKERTNYSHGGGPSHGGGHLMAPPGPAVGGYNAAVQAQALNPALGQALSALLANQGAGLGLGNLLGGLGGAPVNQGGPPPAAYGNQAAYANQPAIGYGNQPGLQPQYQNPQMGQGGGVRPHPGPGGAPYMGH